MPSKIEKDAYRYAIKNAFLHKGKASQGAVVGKLIALHGKDASNLIKISKEQVEKVNSLSFSIIESEYKKFENDYELKPQEKPEGLPEIPNLKKAITRFAPNPSAHPHIGHARAAILCYEYSRKYSGKFTLRLDDTDPKIKKILSDSKKIFIENLEWLGTKPDKFYFATDNMEKYYDYMQKLVSLGQAYVCICKSEKWRELTRKGEPCPCRSKNSKEQEKEFAKMLNHTYKEGEAVLRLKTDLKHKDPSVRDWWLAKIVDNPIHPFVKDKHIWPSYNFSSALEDKFEDITLIIRGQEHEQNATKQKFLYKIFNWEYPFCIHYGRIISKEYPISKSEILKGIKEGKYTGWDDPRLLTLEALRKRGIKPEAIKHLILDMGTTTSDANYDSAKLENYNRSLIEGCQRFPLFKNIREIQLDKEYKIEKDNLKYKISKVFIPSEAKGLVKFRELGNFEIKNCQAIPSEKDTKIIVDWISEPLKIFILEKNSQKKEYYTEKSIEKQKEYVYFSKYGFCKKDSEFFRFTHS